MNINELFIDGNELPKPLSRHEVYELLEKIKQGDELAREKLVVHNIRLVLYEVTSRFESVEYDKKDLVSIGNIGLLKAVTTFDTSKRVEFSTYAARCIDNEILMFLKKLKKERKIDSLDRTINYDKDGNELKVEDIIGDGTDIVEEYTDNETYQIIRQIVKDLPYRDRKIIMLHFGFFNNKTYTQNEIADQMSISQTYVSLLIKKIVKKLGKQLQQKGVIELRTEVKNKAKTRKKSRKLQTIYEHFSSYAKVLKDDDEGFTYEISKCLYFDTCKAHGYPEFCKVFCTHDWYAYGVLKKHSKFVRKSTIAEDGTVCNDTILKLKQYYSFYMAL